MNSLIRGDEPLDWEAIAEIAGGASLALSDGACARIDGARLLVEQIVARGIRAYGVNTGVGALCNTVVSQSQQRDLSHNILMSHAVGVGPLLGREAVRAIMASAVNNFAHGHSGVRLAVVRQLTALLNADLIPEVPTFGSVGYLSHMAHIALVCVGAGWACANGVRVSGDQALRQLGLAPLSLEAKEGLSLVNGTPCVTGLAVLALARARRLLEWADGVAAMTFENLQGQLDAFDAQSLAFRVSPGLETVGARLRGALAGSGILAVAAGRRTQDSLSLRAIAHVHGAARDVFADVARAVDRELASVTDNPIVAGTPDDPHVYSQAHAVSASLALAMDSLGVALAQVAAMSERRIDRLVNPLVSGLPAFLAADGGTCSGLMIAQYTAASLVAQNHREAAPASLDGGVTSGLQEDHLCHATPAALKALNIIENGMRVVAIELLAAVQAYDLQDPGLPRSPYTEALRAKVRSIVPIYRDDRPLADDMNRAFRMIADDAPAPLADQERRPSRTHDEYERTS